LNGSPFPGKSGGAGAMSAIPATRIEPARKHGPLQIGADEAADAPPGEQVHARQRANSRPRAYGTPPSSAAPGAPGTPYGR
jgi:hypothetical protein